MRGDQKSSNRIPKIVQLGLTCHYFTVFLDKEKGLPALYCYSVTVFSFC